MIRFQIPPPLWGINKIFHLMVHFFYVRIIHHADIPCQPLTALWIYGRDQRVIWSIFQHHIWNMCDWVCLNLHILWYWLKQFQDLQMWQVYFLFYFWNFVCEILNNNWLNETDWPVGIISFGFAPHIFSEWPNIFTNRTFTWAHTFPLSIVISIPRSYNRQSTKIHRVNPVAVHLKYMHGSALFLSQKNTFHACH